MNASEIFVDTNILLYAHDLQAGDKHQRAKEIVRTLWAEREVPSLSIQVLQEMHVNLLRKGTSLETSAEIVSRYLSWRVVSNTRSLFRLALDVQRRWQLSFWDASVVAAAQRAGARKLWTEDLSHGQDYGGVVVVNPLVPSV